MPASTQDPSLKTVRLYGHLGERFGKEHRFSITSPSEALRALKANFPEFEQCILDHNLPGYRIVVGDATDASKFIVLHGPVSDNEVIHITPAVIGGKSNFLAFAEIIVGAALLIFAAPLAAGLAGATGLSITAGTIGQIGLTLALVGASALLFKPKAIDGPADSSGNKASSSFGQVVNTAAQGNCVPVGYGRYRVGSQVISAGLYAESY